MRPVACCAECNSPAGIPRGPGMAPESACDLLICRRIPPTPGRGIALADGLPLGRPPGWLPPTVHGRPVVVSHCCQGGHRKGLQSVMQVTPFASKIYCRFARSPGLEASRSIRSRD